LDQSEATEKFSLSRDHFNMNKFSKPEEEDFETVCEVIEAMANVLARRGLIDDVPDPSEPRMVSRNTGRSKTSRFHFSVRLRLPYSIFTQNIFLIS